MPDAVAPGRASEIDLVRAFFESLEADDLDRALSHLSADVEYQNMPLRPTRGKAAVRAVLRPLLRFTTGFEARINHIAAADGVVLTERTDAVLIGPVRIDFPVCGSFAVEDGAITLWRDTFDWATVFLNALLAGPRWLIRKRPSDAPRVTGRPMETARQSGALGSGAMEQ